MWKYILAWFPMVILAIGNGIARASVYEKHLGELRAHQLSTVSGVVLLGAFMWFVVRRWPPASGRQALGIGLLWLGMTVGFEFLFGHFVVGHPWERLLADYNLFAGRLWVLVLVWVAVAPCLFHRLRR